MSLPPELPCIAILGMNGVGKSNIGKRLAAKLKMKRIDTDLAFRALHGKEQGYIDAHGWEAFRRAEEEIILQSLLPGHIVVLGGGAVESERVRSALKEHAVVLWVQGTPKRIHKNLTNAKVTRPEFRHGSSPEAAKALSDARHPFYKEVASIVLPPTTFKEQVPMALRLLQRAMHSQS